MLKRALFATCLFIPTIVNADIVHCGNVEIEQIITGPRHGALLNISNNSCGNSGYVCLDLEGQYSSKEKGSAAYSFALASHMAGRNVDISVDTASKPSSCGIGYPVVEDIRTIK